MKVKDKYNYFKNYWLVNLFFFLLYLVLVCYTASYHEPWHDEAQAWLIARDDSLRQLLTVTTHYEGHPPLWHLILMPFAKLGVPFELGLKAINIFFVAVASGLVIFKSPLPWYLRYTLPFSYYYFYQYGVINRSYSLLLALIMLGAYLYPQRSNRPYAMALTLAAMSATQAYGMMLACGIAMAWLCDVVQQVKGNTAGRLTLKALWAKKESRALALLFVLALATGLLIIPRPDTAFMQIVAEGNSWNSFLYGVFIIPGQIICNNGIVDNIKDKGVEFFFSNLQGQLSLFQNTGFYGILNLVGFLLNYTYGFMFTLALGYMSYRSSKFKLFLFPNLMYALMVTLLHYNAYHAGILAGFYVFMLWQLFEDKQGLARTAAHFQKQFTSAKEYLWVRRAIYGAIAVVMGINIYWSFAAARLEIQQQYDPSRAIAAYIRANKLENTKIWVAPSLSGENDEYIIVGSYAINGYFDKNIIQNLDGGVTRSYHQYQLLFSRPVLEKLKAMGEPDFLIASEKDDKPLRELFGSNTQYIVVKEFKTGKIWKDNYSPNKTFLLGRKDVVEKLGLK